MRKLVMAVLTGATLFAAAPALANHYDDDRYSRRSSNLSWEEQQARTREAWRRNGEMHMRETREAWARNAEYRRHQAWVAEQRKREQQRYDRGYDDRYGYGRDREEIAFRRFADRNRDGRISRSEYQWAMNRW